MEIVPAPLTSAERAALSSGLAKIQNEEEDTLTTEELAAVVREKVLNNEW